MTGTPIFIPLSGGLHFGPSPNAVAASAPTLGLNLLPSASPSALQTAASPVFALPWQRRQTTTLAAHFTEPEFEGRIARRAARITPQAPVNPFLSRLARTFAAHHAEPDFEGRANRRFGFQAGASPVTGQPFQTRLPRIIAAHFADPDFDGRPKPRATVQSGPSPVAGLPFLSPLSRLIAAHFSDADFEGRQRARGVAPGPQTPAAIPFAGRLAQIIAAHFAEPDFEGGRSKRAGRPVQAPAPQPLASRLARLLAAHHAEKDFEGRGGLLRLLRPGFPVPPGPPPLPTGPSARLQAYSAAFPPEVYDGRRAPRLNFLHYGGGSGNPPRVSQIVAEALGGIESTVLASQIILEALQTSPAGVRASQLVAEALYQQDNPTYVRASQLVIEVLVPFTELPVIPVYPQLVGLTFDYVKRVKTSVGRGVGSSGREIAVNYWANPQWEWDLNYDILADTAQMVGTTSSDIKTLTGFVLAMQGTYQPFFFQDPDDNQVTGQALGVGDGVTTVFAFVRTYGLDSALGDFTGTEPVGSVNSGETLAIYLNGVEQSTGFTTNFTTPYGNFVTFATAPAPGVAVTADFSFYYYCRIKDDTTEFTKFMNQLWALKKITLFSLKG